jgi:hypothetical protein
MVNVMSEQDDLVETDLDRATSARLAQLRSMPVDTSRLDAMLRAQLPRDEEGKWRMLSLRPLHAIAASIAALLIVGVILLTSSAGPVLASPAQMAQMHEDIVAGRTHAMQVDSIAAANRMLAGQSRHLPAVPEIPPDHVMACCMRSVKDKKVACVLLQTDGVPVTMTVANAADLRLPAAPTITRDGVTYRAQTSGKLSMVMTERDGRWVCLIGQLTQDQLIDLASKLQF